MVGRCCLRVKTSERGAQRGTEGPPETLRSHPERRLRDTHRGCQGDNSENPSPSPSPCRQLALQHLGSNTVLTHIHRLPSRTASGARSQTRLLEGSLCPRRKGWQAVDQQEAGKGEKDSPHLPCRRLRRWITFIMFIIVKEVLEFLPRNHIY